MARRGGSAGGQVRASERGSGDRKPSGRRNPTESEHSGRDNPQTSLVKGKHVSSSGEEEKQPGKSIRWTSRTRSPVLGLKHISVFSVTRHLKRQRGGCKGRTPETNAN